MTKCNECMSTEVKWHAIGLVFDYTTTFISESHVVLHTVYPVAVSFTHEGIPTHARVEGRTKDEAVDVLFDLLTNGSPLVTYTDSFHQNDSIHARWDPTYGFLPDKEDMANISKKYGPFKMHKTKYEKYMLLSAAGINMTGEFLRTGAVMATKPFMQHLVDTYDIPVRS